MNYKMRNQIKQYGLSQSLVDVFKPHEDLLKRVTKLAFAVSTVLVIWYCALNRFIPDLKLEDSIVFIWVSCAFIFVITLGTFMGGMSCIWVFWALNWGFKNKMTFKRFNLPKYLDEPWIHIFSFTLFLFYALFIAYLWNQTNASHEKLNLLLTFFMTGFISLVAIITYNSKQITIKELLLFFIAAILLSFFWAKPVPILNLIFRASAIRQENVDVIVSPNNFNEIKDYARIYKVPIRYCYQQNSDTYLVRGVNLVWYGIGQTALLAISAEPTQSRLGFSIQIPLKAEGVRPLPVLMSEGVQSKESEVRKNLCECDG